MKLTFLLPLFWTIAAVHGATLNVTTTADTGPGSLRAQVAAAASGDTVAITTSGTITLTTGEIVIAGRNLSIAGPGANNLTLTTNAASRALKIVNAQCTISGLTFQNCKALAGDVDTGGAIAVDNFTAGGRTNVTTITDCVFTGNQSGWGGAVDVFQGGLALSRCSFSANTCTGLAFATNGGGGALSLGPTLASTIANCTFSGNAQNGVATGQPGGGAIYNYGAGVVSPAEVAIEHCTFVGNLDAAAAAGAIKGNYTVSYHTWANLKNCLLVNNQAPASVLRNFSGNPASLTATYASLGGNVTDEATTSGQFMGGSIDRVSNPAVAATVAPTLALNGGVTPTHAIARGSAAQRSGQPSSVSTDQRGAPRHTHGDAGAFELIEPELGVTVAAAPLPEAGTLDFGSTPFASPVAAIVTITNRQTSNFTTGPLTLADVSASSAFSVANFPTTPLANGQSATFQVTLSAAHPGLFQAPLTFTGNDTYDTVLGTAGGGAPNAHVFHLTGLVTDTVDHWRAQYFGAAASNFGEAADHANPSGDGIVNLLKYSLGLDPNIAYPSGVAAAAALDPQGCLRMTVNKNPAAADVRLEIEVTGQLGDPGAWSTAGVTVDRETLTTLEAHDSTPMATAQSRFIRLKASRR